MSIVIFGAGFLGRRLARDLPGATLVHTDITDRLTVESVLRDLGADAVVNAAGKTGHPNVDWCESHREDTYRSNVVGALTLAEACGRAGAYLLHLGSGCIFYGESPTAGGWREDDLANPSAFYSRTKYAADLVLAQLPNVAVARLRMPIDHEPGPRNLITKVTGYRNVVDVTNSVTVVDDLVVVVSQLLAARPLGFFHVTNPGTMRHRDLVALYRELVDPSHTCEFIDAPELVARGLAVRQRSNCILASTRLAELGITMRPIDVALRETMLAYATAARRR